MRHLLRIILAFMIGFPTISYPQKGYSVGIAPIGLIGKIAITTEYEANNKFGLGLIYSYNYLNVALVEEQLLTEWGGNKFEVHGRYYMVKSTDTENSDGIYLIVQPGIAFFKTPYIIYVDDGYGSSKKYENYFYNEVVYVPHERSFGSGIGFGFGYKRQIKHMYLDFNFRFQRWSVENKSSMWDQYRNEKNAEYRPLGNDDFQSRLFLGPSSLIAPTLILGYKFY